MYDASIIIPTYNRVDSLLETLESLALQICASDRFEVVVVDDGSNDETPDIANRAFPFTLRYVRQANQGGVAARNTGATIATGELLIFLDDDMTAQVGYVGALIEASTIADRSVLRGQLLPWLPDVPSLFARIYEQSTREVPIAEDSESSPGLFASNNMAIRRDEFWRLGGWVKAVDGEPGLQGGIWADLEFAHRAMQSGLHLVTVAGARIYHRDYVLVNLTAASERARKVSKLAVPVLQCNPALNAYLPMFVDKMPIAWKQDSLKLIARKLVRAIASQSLIVRALLFATRCVEHTGKSPFLLVPLYRWIIGAHHFQGYSEGLRSVEVQQVP